MASKVSQYGAVFLRIDPMWLECQPIQTSLCENRSRTVRLQNPAVDVDRTPAVESVAMPKDVESLTATDDPS